MSNRTVIVIGGGVIGLSAAYRLAKRKCGRVFVLEKGPVGNGASSCAAGIVTGHLWSKARRAGTQEGVRVIRRAIAGFLMATRKCFDEPGKWPIRIEGW